MTTESNHPFTKVRELELTTKIHNCLEKEGIETIVDLLNCSKEDLLKIPKLGPVAVGVVVEELGIHGLKLSESRPGPTEGKYVVFGSSNDSRNVYLRDGREEKSNKILRVGGYINLPELKAGQNVRITIELI